MKNIISVSSLEKSYKDHQVLKGVSFNVREGSIFALLGSNGAGKTTAVRILSTLSKPDGGSASICGHDVVRQSEHVRGCISLTGQYAAVDESLTGRENLRLIGMLKRLSDVRKKTNELLAAFRLEDAADRRASTYSGGMRRRLDIAMSLMGRPQVLFLDEPTTGLDPQNRKAAWEMIKGLADEGTTVFLTTQYLEEAEQLADHIAILHGGKITAEGTPGHLKKILPQGSIQLDFHDHADTQKACGLLGGYSVRLDVDSQNTIHVSTDGGTGQFADVLNILNNAGVPIERFTQKLPSLEDVFLTIIDEKNDRVK